MDSKQMFDEHHLQKWAQIVRECSESPMTKKAFCQSIGISETRYYYWQKRVRDAVCEQLLKIREDFGIADESGAGVADGAGAGITEGALVLSDDPGQSEALLVPYERQQDFAEVVVHKAAAGCACEAYVVHEVVEDNQKDREVYDNHHNPRKPTQHGQIHIEAEGLKFTADSSYPISQLAELLKGLVM